MILYEDDLTLLFDRPVSNKQTRISSPRFVGPIRGTGLRETTHLQFLFQRKTPHPYSIVQSESSACFLCEFPEFASWACFVLGEQYFKVL